MSAFGRNHKEKSEPIWGHMLQSAMVRTVKKIKSTATTKIKQATVNWVQVWFYMRGQRLKLSLYQSLLAHQFLLQAIKDKGSHITKASKGNFDNKMSSISSSYPGRYSIQAETQTQRPEQRTVLTANDSWQRIKTKRKQNKKFQKCWILWHLSKWIIILLTQFKCAQSV